MNAALRCIRGGVKDGKTAWVTVLGVKFSERACAQCHAVRTVERMKGDRINGPPLLPMRTFGSATAGLAIHDRQAPIWGRSETTKLGPTAKR